MVVFNTNTSSVVISVAIVFPVTNIEPLIPTLPVNSCLSTTLSPNLLLPLAKIIEADI